MNAALQWLQRPFPFTDEKTILNRKTFIGGGFVAVFLYLFRPFGLQSVELSEWQRLAVSLQYGLVTVAVTILWSVLIRLLPRFYDERKWNVGREIVSELGFITVLALGNMLYTAWRWSVAPAAQNFLPWVAVTLAVGIFPITYGIFIKQLRLARRYSQEASQISTQIPAAPAETGVEAITLHGDNQGEVLTLPVQQLLFIEAADNYVRVVWTEAGTEKQRLLRTTLKKAEQDIAHHPALFRCHRAYIVNLKRVQSLSGNAQGYKLHLSDTAFIVPVSRNANDSIRQKLS
jgi:LytTr DNA-binding domain